MSLFALASGKLFAAPEQRTSKNGNAFIKATLVVVSGAERQFLTLFAFSESARAELARLSEGDALSVQGPLKAEIFERDGRGRISLSMTVDAVLALRQPPKERKPREKTSRREDDLRLRPPEDHRAGSDADLNDDIPF